MAGIASWLQLLEARQPSSVRLGIERIAAARSALGLELGMPVITVGGTNGKGSTAAFIDAILRAEGYRTGCFFSPHVHDFRERIAISGQPASEDALCAAFERVEAAGAKSAPAAGQLTYFEFVALAAAAAFADAQAEAVVLEVGLGGRLDAVNAFDADVSVIASLGIDHVEHLGGDLESIAREKAGILRAGKPAVCGATAVPASLREAAASVGAKLLVRGRDFAEEIQPEGWCYRGRTVRAGLPRPAMHGRHQYANASCALCALEQLGDRLPVTQAAAREGLIRARLPGRFEVLPGPVPVVLDVAHNVAAAHALSGALLDMGYFERTIAVFGARARKDIAGIVDALAGRIDEWHIAPVGEAHAQEAAAAAAAAAREGCDAVSLHPSVAAAAEAAHASAGSGARIAVLGSFLTVAEYCRSSLANPAQAETAA